MDERKIELGKQYRTRDGREVRIYAVDGELPCNVHGAVRRGDAWKSETWDRWGNWALGSDSQELDLIEVKPKITRTYWLVHMKTGFTVSAVVKPTQTYPDCIAITGPHEVTFTEGEGL